MYFQFFALTATQLGLNGTIRWQEYNQATSHPNKFYNLLNMMNTTVVHHHYAVRISAIEGA